MSNPKNKKTKSTEKIRRKRLMHRRDSLSHKDLESLPKELLPPASSGNTARQVIGKLGITFPIQWRKIEKKAKNVLDG